MRILNKNSLLFFLLIIFLFWSLVTQASQTLLNVSYDSTRELYREIDENFIKYYKKKSGENLMIHQSHGGSGRQARSVIDGLNADIVTLSIAYDIDSIVRRGLIQKSWRDRLENNSSPYNSIILFMVRKGNPKKIKDWNDLIRPDISIITPNPKTSGGARLNYLAAWAYAQNHYGNQIDKSKKFMSLLLKNVAVLDTGARGSTTTFVERKQGDVLLAWESEALLSIKELGSDKFDIVIPSLSILAELPVSIVDKVVDRKGTRKAAQAYLEWLYTPFAQEIIAKNFYRPINKDIFHKYYGSLPKVKLVTVEQMFGDWNNAQKEHFSDGGIFDQIHQFNNNLVNRKSN